MDAFYASVELLRYPELRGTPVVIGGGRRHQPVLRSDGTREFATLRDYAGRGVITTSHLCRAASSASAFGHGHDESRHCLCPQAILLPVDFDQYRRFSRLLQVDHRCGRSPRSDGRPRRGRGLHRPHATCPAAQRRRRPGAGAAHPTQSSGPRRHRPDLLGRRRRPTSCSSKMAIRPSTSPMGISVVFGSPTCRPCASGRWPAKKINGIGPKADDQAQAGLRHPHHRRACRSATRTVAHRAPSARATGAWMHAAAHGAATTARW